MRLLKYIVLAVVLTSACSKHFKPSSTQAYHYDLINIKNDSVSDARILPYKLNLHDEMNTVIAYSDSILTKDGFETTLGNFVLQAIQHYLDFNKTEIKTNYVIFTNRGGLRNSLPLGNIKKESIFELMPFDNEIVVLTIKGDKLKNGFKSVNENGKLLSWNLFCKIINNKVEDVRIGKSEFDSEKSYTVVTSDYIANGGDDSFFLSNPESYETTNVKLRDAIIEYCVFLTKQNTHIKPYKDGRITIEK